MAQNNGSNPYTRDPDATRRDVPKAITKAKVLGAKKHPSEQGYHIVTVQEIYGDKSVHEAPVLTPMFGSVWVPPKGTTVALMFGPSDKPWVIGSWYPIDRVEEGNVDLPEYEAGDIRLGNESGSHLTVYNDGYIKLVTDGTEPIDIDTQSASTYLDVDYDISGTDTYEVVPFDTVENDPDGLFNSTTHSYQIEHYGQYTFDATIEVSKAGQNNRYTIGIFVDDVLQKRKTQQSVVKSPMSVSVSLQTKLDGGETVDIRLRQDSGSAKTILGDSVSNSFNVQRWGI